MIFMNKNNQKQRPVLAISSGGGHWIQLLKLNSSWKEYSVVYASVSSDYSKDVFPNRFYLIPDGNFNTKLKLIKIMIRILYLIIHIRPEVVISTGAAPGFFALVFGKLTGSKTIWVDSIANADELSLSGRKVKFFADVWLTQWEHLSSIGGPEFRGSIL